MRQWRLIYDTPTFGPLNMAVDSAILEAVSIRNVPPTLRIYAWEPFCLSLGYAQKAADADISRIKAQGWDLVRRPTGGRAILHGDELTYSVTLPEEHPLAEGSVVESYRRISGALMLALGKIGLRTHAERQHKRAGDLGPVCFEVPSHYEITAYGRKLIGSAQVRRKQGILQHGTLPLTGDVARICDALTYPDEQTREHAKKQVRDRATTLEEALGQPVSWREAAEAIVQGFTEAFDIDFQQHTTLTPHEETLTEALLADTYANESYTLKR